MPARRAPTDKERASALGSEVRRLRRARGLSQRQVAEALPISPSSLGRIETGEYGPPASETIFLIAQILEVDPDPLLRLAGRLPHSGGPGFEERVLAELGEVRAALERVTADVSAMVKWLDDHFANRNEEGGT